MWIFDFYLMLVHRRVFAEAAKLTANNEQEELITQASIAFLASENDIGASFTAENEDGTENL